MLPDDYTDVIRDVTWDILEISLRLQGEAGFSNDPAEKVIPLGSNLGQVILSCAIAFSEENNVPIDTAIAMVTTSCNDYMKYAISSLVCTCENGSHCIDRD